MNPERPRKNFKTDNGTPQGQNQIKYFGEQPQQNQASYQQQNFGGYNNYGASNDSKKIKKPKNKLNLNKYHQPIFKKENEGKMLKKKARDLQRLIEKEDVAEEIKQAKSSELQEVNQKIEIKKKKQKRVDRKIQFLQQKYKSIMNVAGRAQQITNTYFIKYKTEMKKVIRSLQKNEKLISQTLDDEKKKTLLAEKKDLQMKYNYIKNFPKDKKYLSLFPKEENEKMVALRTKIMKEIQSRVDQKEKYLNKIELDPKKKEEEKSKQKGDKKKKAAESSEEDSEMDIEEEQSSDESESEEENVKMPKLGKKYVDNFFVAPNSKVDEKSQIKTVGKDGKVLKTVPQKKTLSDSDSDSSDEDSD